MKSLITAKVDTRELQKVLASLPEKVRQSVQRRGMRQALNPVRDALRQGWARQPRRRTGKHTAAIVDATVTDVRRGRGGTVVGKVGVNYKIGGTRSKQRIWHLLEAGFRHFGSSKAYAPRGAKVREQAKARSKFFREAFNQAMAANPGRSKAAKAGQAAMLRAASTRARQLFPELAASNLQRGGLARTLRRAAAKRVHGLGISARIGRAKLQETTSRAAAETLSFIDKHLKGKGAA